MQKLSLVLVLVVAVGVVCSLGAYTPPRSYQQTMISLAQCAQIIYAADATTTYVAIAEPGTADTAATWQCKKIARSGLATTVTWADGDNKVDNLPGTGGTGLPGLTYE